MRRSQAILSAVEHDRPLDERESHRRRVLENRPRVARGVPPERPDRTSVRHEEDCLPGMNVRDRSTVRTTRS